MSRPSPLACAHCGTPIPARAAGGLCPACLMAGALGGGEFSEARGKGGPRRALPGHRLEPDQRTDYPRALGNYHLLARLGSGGMGTVYEAEHASTSRRVALKVLGQGLDSPDMRQRFLREGRLAASISHPNCLYVFGTEEIDQQPIITMEVASGGTLEDRLRKHGPLPMAAAVDAALDVIAGLEAAFAAGVLHRDIKPSNCFVAADGSIKVGDFGLSVATRLRPGAPLQGGPRIASSAMGTPAFASPEQLRGAESDQRADIYSVGATLFYLLVGEAPIRGRSTAEVIAASQEKTPPALSTLHAGVPAELAQVVARCLAKDPEQRYASHAALRHALLPFASTRPVPAPLGRRLIAGFLDLALCGILPAVTIHAVFGFDIDDRHLFRERSAAQLQAWGGLTLFMLLYYACFEGLWGAGPGKALMGLRMTRANGRAAGVGRALARSSLGSLFGNTGKLVCFAWITPQFFASGGAFLVAASNLIATLAFVTVRRRNGFATVWDLATGTRVVVRPRGQPRPVLRIAPLPQAPGRPAESIGPYSITGEVVAGRWLTGWDSALQRPVWLRRSDPQVPPARQGLARPGRCRWLQSLPAPQGDWDVLEGPSGGPLSAWSPATPGLPWRHLRHWLHDLESELSSATQDGTLPPRLSQAQVWIHKDGRALLLDEAWPAAAAPETETFSASELSDQRRFLAGLAARVDPVTVPLHARSPLERLSTSSSGGSLQALLNKPAYVSRQLRAASLLAIPILLVTFVALIAAGDRAPGLSEAQDPRLGFLALLLITLAATHAIPQLLGLMTLRATPGQLAFGLAVLDPGGAPAGRRRLCLRWLVAWALPLVALARCIQHSQSGFAGPTPLSILLVVAWLIGLGLAIWSPGRGPHDRLSGCWLVPR